MKKIILPLLLITGISSASVVDIQKNLKPFLGEIKAENITKTKFKGVSEILIENPIETIFVSNDGKYLIQGDIIDIKARAKMSSGNKVNSLKKQLLASVKADDKITFKAKNEKYAVDVFTDVDCPFCAKLHAEMDKMNDLGITINYLASPLAQLHPTAQSKMEKIWCAKDKTQAMDNYKRNRVVPQDSPKCDNPVAKQLKLAQKLGVNGTPALFLPNGEKVGGYLPAKSLLQRLENMQK